MTDYSTDLLNKFLNANGLKAMDLIRSCDVAVTTAYRIVRGEPLHDLDTLYKIYQGLKSAGYEVTWEQITGIK